MVAVLVATAVATAVVARKNEVLTRCTVDHWVAVAVPFEGFSSKLITQSDINSTFWIIPKY